MGGGGAEAVRQAVGGKLPQRPRGGGWSYCRVPLNRGGGSEKGMAAIGQVWTHNYCSSRACPTAFIALSVHRMFSWPLAHFAVHSCPCPFLRGWGLGSGLLGSGVYRRVTSHGF